MDRRQLKHLKNQWKQMNYFLNKKKAEGDLHEQVLDRLAWLKKRMNNCEESSDYHPLLFYFNETVYFFNQKLGLKGNKKFKEM